MQCCEMQTKTVFVCNECFPSHLEFRSYCCSSLRVHLKHHGKSPSHQIRGGVCTEWVGDSNGSSSVVGVILPLKHSTADSATLLPNTPGHFCLHLSRGERIFYSLHACPISCSCGVFKIYSPEFLADITYSLCLNFFQYKSITSL